LRKEKDKGTNMKGFYLKQNRIPTWFNY